MKWDERRSPIDDIFNRSQDVTSEFIGTELAYFLTEWMKKHGDSPSPTGQYLAVGAGYAIGEMAFAKALGVDPANTTLVDKNLPPVSWFPNQTDTQRFSEPISSFLAKQPRQPFDIVSAFAMEHVFTDDRVGHFLDALALHLNPGAYVVIYPYRGQEQEAAIPSRFSRLPDSNNQVRFYRFNGTRRGKIVKKS